MVTATKTKLTYQDYAKTPDGERYELLDGELIMAPAANMPHQETSMNLSREVSLFVKKNGLGRVFHAPTDVVLADTIVVQPDVLFVSKEREGIITHANIQGAPDFVVEILSPSTAQNDWRRKWEIYERHGVKEYWIVDPANRIVYVMLARNGALEMENAYSEADTVKSSTIHGFSVKVADIF